MQYRHPTSRLLLNFKEKPNKFQWRKDVNFFKFKFTEPYLKNSHHFVLSNTPYYLLS